MPDHPFRPRFTRFAAFVLLSSVASFGCSDARVTGPEARVLYRRYMEHGVSAKGYSLFLNGSEVPEDSLTGLKPEDIDSVQIVKGDHRRILIFTRAMRNAEAPHSP